MTAAPRRLRSCAVNLADRVAVALVRHTPLRDRRRRKRLVRARNRLFERLGSERFAKPANLGLEDALLPFLPDRPGVFFEAGANDGYTQSNTYWLERCRGWSGVLVEGIPELAEECRADRPRSRTFQCALVPPELSGTTVSMRFGDTVSLVEGAKGSPEADIEHVEFFSGSAGYEVDVPARTISEVLDEAGTPHVDVFFLDIEGYELPALQGMDFDRHRPGLMVLEALDRDALAELDAFMAGVGYERVTRLAADDYVYRPSAPTRS
jgi:FkbM family methyltransferase